MGTTSMISPSQTAAGAVLHYAIFFVGAILFGTSASSREPARERRKLPEYERPIVVAHDNEFVLLRCGDEVVAFRTTTHPRYGCDGIVYRWFRVNDKVGRFFAPSRNSVEVPENPEVESGCGTIVETIDALNVDIVIGKIAISWSKRDTRSGYLYIGHADATLQNQPPIEIYAKRFRSLADASGKLAADGWRVLDLQKKEEKIDGSGRKSGPKRRSVESTQSIPAGYPRSVPTRFFANFAEPRADEHYTRAGMGPKPCRRRSND